jgi:hypothetical protein
MLDDINPVRPNAGGRDPAFAAAMRRAEGGPPAAEPHPRSPIARTRVGTVIRRNDEPFAPGPLLDVSHLPVV